MAKFWTKIMVPAALLGAFAIQTFGVDATRASRLHAWFPRVQQDTIVSRDTLPVQDTLPLPDTLVVRDTTAGLDSVLRDTLPPLPDSLTAAARDSIGLDDEELLFYEEEAEDTVPRIFARDTMKVPDSLKVTDPFLYQWYVAVKDSYTHKLVVDSLRAEGDSLIWPRIDSLFLADSTAAAIERFNKWYASLSKSERKRYDYEQRLPALLHKQDSIQHRKDSIQRRRDSIIQNTPRILETAFLPDSLYYKRMVAWHHDSYFNRVTPFQWDTTADYHFYDYPFMHQDVGASWQGMPGSAVQTYNFFNRDLETPSFYAPYESWTYSPSTLPMFNTKMPYTELEYYGNLFNSSTLSSDAFRVFTTQNILPQLNVALEMKRYGGAGSLKSEKTDNRTYFVAGNYLGKKYLAHAGFIYNKVTRQENGGIQDNMWIRDTTVDVREIDITLSTASSRSKKTTLFLDQSFRIPFDFIDEIRHRGDTSWVKPDTLNTDMPTGFVGTSSEYSVFGRKYVDETNALLSTFYHDIFNISPGKSRDSMQVTRLDNRLFVRFQPWRENAPLSKIEGGIGDRLQTFYLSTPDMYLKKSVPVRWNSLYAYAGAEGSFRKYLDWDALALFNFAGTEAGDFKVQGNAALKLYPFQRSRKTPLTLGAHFETSLKEPEFYAQYFYSNHFAWENSFSKISTTRLRASLDIPQWRLHADAGYSLVGNHIYYDTLGLPRQHNTPISVLSARLQKDFVLGLVHLENNALFQVSSQPEVLPLPKLAVNLRWYLQLILVSPETMKLQIGANVRYNTLWYAPAFNPVTGTFVNQREELYGNCPVFDVFINAQWQRVSVFLKMENLGNGWPMAHHDYFTAHHYIQTSRVLKFGVSWPFYPRLGEAKAMSSRASSGGMGMGSSGGGGMSGLKGALGNFGGN